MIYVYLACPVRPIEGSGETVQSNLARAREYYRVLSLAHSDKVFLAPWILNCEVFPETPEMIELGMKRNYATIDLISTHERQMTNAAGIPYVATRPKGYGGQLWLCGPRVSQNMQKEGDYATRRGLLIKRHKDMAIEAEFSPPERCWINQHCCKPSGHEGGCVS